MKEHNEQQNQQKIKRQERRLIMTCFVVGGVMLTALLRHYL
ncbi:hypothetical protein J40TS1_04580 [Paenibacillus montaniterrae]|uniref:Uncharacterized protein n=1 Tax=Paenibacillus montaniterrae TaxID=429341 RepID=A0A919YP36_9BACL|nr:hypothetical protein [Paenibacillus montaniterrae]GIP14816.1 hypothetical protein J40TS1_04580 [Paenibacillus montaniterrae]